MDSLDTREWLLTNGLGSFASGTVCEAKTRKYHGWLIAALDPPGKRTLLLSHLDASLEVAGKVIALGTNFWLSGENQEDYAINPEGYQLLRSFGIDPVPTWIWGQDNWQLTRRLVMPHGLSTSETDSETEFSNRILIQYRYQGSQPAILWLRPLIGDRNFHHQQLASCEIQFSQLIAPQQIVLQSLHQNHPGTPWQLRWSKGQYYSDPIWYWNYYYPEEHRRGEGAKEDLYSPGYLQIGLQPQESLILEARTGWLQNLPPLSPEIFSQTLRAEEKRLSQIFPSNYSHNSISQRLLQSSDRFVAYRTSLDSPTIIAGYPWFDDWGRDTLIALPGLALATKRYRLAKGLLKTFGCYCRDGIIPNTFPDAEGEPIYNSIDASLWWIEILGLYLEATADWAFLKEQYPVVRKIYKAFRSGTRYNIHVDASDGLLTWDAPNVALTWMDAIVNGEPITPRRGKTVEINALWYSALCWANQWATRLLRERDTDSERLEKEISTYTQQAKKVKASLQKFWYPQIGYLSDAIEPDDRLNTQIRPNGIIALSLHHCGFYPEQGRKAINLARERLLTPYGLRSLDPGDPEYVGSYLNSSEWRDRAYHQGTVWSWLIGPFIRSWERFYPEQPLPFDWQPLLTHFEEQACLGSVSEIFDGDPPHAPQGAIAQAWSVAEILRHYLA
ncbi:amylo-alpha-1,6-glucosidase [Oscillatoria salina]|uniref:amylo-alpha-1,6-glucosidase n=1 Tax=Oscillatoria salina TaxID=331517 RepID=UPI001CC95386|nr:amylo-alpha-1,6-glucosidase [Oscillatoria salina]MBZ8180272.1 amylo-alpha-1,6-glucosidase [Oscillatoria salina IIICB1]